MPARRTEDDAACPYCGRRFGLPYGKPGWYDSLMHHQTLNLVFANADRHVKACERRCGKPAQPTPEAQQGA